MSDQVRRGSSSLATPPKTAANSTEWPNVSDNASMKTSAISTPAAAMPVENIAYTPTPPTKS